MKAALNLTLSALMLSACVPSASAPAAAPAPVARPAPAHGRPAPAPAPLPAPAHSAGWMDGPATSGGWSYLLNSGKPVALFIGLGGRGEFVISCDKTGGTIGLSRRTSAASSAMTIRTETATRSLQTTRAEPYLIAKLASVDPLLDAMALSKGRFAVEVDGSEPLYLPSWAEVSRVIEDCR